MLKNKFKLNFISLYLIFWYADMSISQSLFSKFLKMDIFISKHIEILAFQTVDPALYKL